MRLRDIEALQKDLTETTDDLKGGQLALQMAQRKLDATGGASINEAGIKSISTRMRPHIKNMVMEVAMERGDDIKMGDAGGSEVSEAPKRNLAPTNPAKSNKRPKRTVAEETESDDEGPGMDDDDDEGPTMEEAPPKEPRWEAKPKEEKLVRKEFEQLGIKKGDALDALVEGTYFSIRCGVFSPTYLYRELSKYEAQHGKSDDEVNAVVGKVKTWSHKVAQHHGQANNQKKQNGYKPRTKRGGGARGR